MSVFPNWSVNSLQWNNTWSLETPSSTHNQLVLGRAGNTAVTFFNICLALSETPQFYRYNWGLDWQWALWQAEVGAYPGQRHESEATRTRAKCLQVQGVCVLLCISGWLTIHWVIHTGLEPSCPCLPGPAMTGFLWIHLCSALIDCGVISVFTGDAALSLSGFGMSSLGIWVILASWNGLG